MVFLPIASAVLTPPAHMKAAESSPLQQWLRRPDPEFKWSFVKNIDGGRMYTMTSQKWHGVTWKHSLYYFDAAPHSYRPGGLSDAAILQVAGDDPRPDELNTARQLSFLSGLPTVVLFNIPNQPLFGQEEDGLMAHTFEKAIQSKDMTWPLLYPMTKSVVKAMDAVEAATHKKVHRFVIYGNSKRGWTTWLAGESGDKRIAGIAPASIDILNIPGQLQRQMQIWGHYSPMYDAYKESGLLGKVSDPGVQGLVAGIDPYTHLKSLKIPVFSIRGASDPFWAPDAVSIFKDRLPESTWLLNLPNEGHDYADPKLFLDDLAAFSRTAAARDPWPHVHATASTDGIKVETSRMPVSVRLYAAESDNAEFPAGSWLLQGISAPSKDGFTKTFHFDALPHSKKWTAWFISAKFDQHVGFRPQTFVISSPIVLKQN